MYIDPLELISPVSASYTRARVYLMSEREREAARIATEMRLERELEIADFVDEYMSTASPSPYSIYHMMAEDFSYHMWAYRYYMAQMQAERFERALLERVLFDDAIMSANPLAIAMANNAIMKDALFSDPVVTAQLERDMLERELRARAFLTA